MSALPAKLTAHPSVQAVLARPRTTPPTVIDATWLRDLCLAAGADDAAVVSLDHPDLAGEREHALTALPGTRSLIAMAFRMNRDNLRSPARSVANQEFHRPTNRPTTPPAPSPRRCRTPATARSTRRSASRRRWTATPAASGSSRTRPSPSPRASA
ncbi:hypothetical protein [Lentzea aerocolonigenes]|uniref:hypothetical protein n=1 Tax=Lentzea aerocolonigenes TaxID=68170 RepID=UPI00191C2EEF|nr:hypothetical protein [Lentzea aerocolonigenes]